MPSSLTTTRTYKDYYGIFCADCHDNVTLCDCKEGYVCHNCGYSCSKCNKEACYQHSFGKVIGNRL